ncbi:hypothetical protein PVAND_010131 [Polypedilum vanderplanki]|uniref:Uncharacterized protein n=1 Tax=Polypedilum vanderplanki TaxID=319348 RepID=A0A9J6CFB7_POLVA|nr:hypothetical protein PVAND_010131 [Polypedilum vanderplanki]
MKVLLISLLILIKTVNLMPITVPVDNNYPDVEDRRPNSHYNRLPNRNPIQSDNSVATDDYDDDDDDDYSQTDKPVSNSQYSSNYNYYGQILTENKVKRKRRKKIKRPCIPIQSFGSQLFSNRLKREVEDKESGKTLNLLNNLFNGYGSPYYGFPPQNFGPAAFPGGSNYASFPSIGNRPFYDNVKPGSDTGSIGNYGPVQFNPIGGYPCVPVSYGHVPHGGPLGFFGNGGLFDGGLFGSVASPPLSYPQTVIINRPPLFGNRPIYDRPGSSSSSSSGSEIESDIGRPGFWGSVVDKLQEFVTSVNPQQVFTAIGDTLQGLGDAIQNAQPVANTANTIRQGYDEFKSLLFR